MDDPLLPGGLASSLYDGEGLPTQTKPLISGGVLGDYLYDSYTAHKDKRESNGSAGRSSFRGTPGPSVSNFFLKPGALPRKKLIADTQDGILVMDVIGMHMADPISGEFSVGISGLAIEGGKLAGAVKGAMLSGNVLELLEKVDAVADDLTFYGSVASPTFRAADLTVA